MGVEHERIGCGQETSIPEDGNYKVVVDRFAQDESSTSTVWTLYRRVEDKWVPCRRDEPADEAIFSLAENVQWLQSATGAYSLTGSRLDAA